MVKKVVLVILVIFAFDLMASDTSYKGEHFTNERNIVKSTNKIDYSEVEKMYLENSMPLAEQVEKVPSKKATYPEGHVSLTAYEQREKKELMYAILHIIFIFTLAIGGIVSRVWLFEKFVSLRKR